MIKFQSERESERERIEKREYPLMRKTVRERERDCKSERV